MNIKLKLVGRFFMKKFIRKKIAFALACTSILGGKTQAVDTTKLKPREPLRQ